HRVGERATGGKALSEHRRAGGVRDAPDVAGRRHVVVVDRVGFEDAGAAVELAVKGIESEVDEHVGLSGAVHQEGGRAHSQHPSEGRALQAHWSFSRSVVCESGPSGVTPPEGLPGIGGRFRGRRTRIYDETAGAPAFAFAAALPGVLSRRSTKMGKAMARSEEHTSELQSRENLVCRLLL